MTIKHVYVRGLTNDAKQKLTDKMICYSADVEEDCSSYQLSIQLVEVHNLVTVRDQRCNNLEGCHIQMEKSIAYRPDH